MDDRTLVYLLAAEVRSGAGKWYTILTAGTGRAAPMSGGKPPTFTRQQLAGYAEQFAAMGRDVAIDVNHALLQGRTDPDSTAARGWIKALRVTGDKLEAAIEWTKDGAKLIADKAFRYFSVELGRYAKDAPVTVIGGTLVNRPAWDLPALTLSAAAFDDIGAGAGASTVEPPSAPAHNVAHEEDQMSDEIKALAQKLGVTEEEVAETVAALSAQVEDLTDKLADAERAAKDAEALAAKVGDKDTAIQALAARLETAEQALGDVAFERAIEQHYALAGRVLPTDEARKMLRVVFDASGAAGVKALAASAEKVPTGQRGRNTADDRGDALTFAAAAEKLTAGVNALMASAEIEYAEAFARFSADPNNAALMAAYERAEV